MDSFTSDTPEGLEDVRILLGELRRYGWGFCDVWEAKSGKPFTFGMAEFDSKYGFIQKQNLHLKVSVEDMLNMDIRSLVSFAHKEIGEYLISKGVKE